MAATAALAFGDAITNTGKTCGDVTDTMIALGLYYAAQEASESDKNLKPAKVNFRRFLPAVFSC